MHFHRPDQPLTSRFLLIGWCLWLVLALMMHRGLNSDHQEVHLLPLMRGLSLSVMLFIGFIWPAWRLTFSLPERTGLHIFREAATLVSIGLLAVATKDMAVRQEDPTAWPLMRTALISMTLLIWSAPVGVTVWWGIRSGRRGGAMALIAFGLIIGWVVVAAGGPASAATISPWHALWVLSSPEPIDAAQISRGLIGIGLLALAAWIGLATQARRSGPRIHGPDPQKPTDGMDRLPATRDKRLDAPDQIPTDPTSSSDSMDGEAV